VIGTTALAHQPGAPMTGTMQADKRQTQGQPHEMNKMDHKPMQMEMANEGIFEGTGEIIALVPDKGQLVIKHQEIPGFMAAMTMGYAVESPALLKGLKPGDVVNFKIDAAKKKIIAIESRR
jgi:Cu/Ag efflux protein CusF